MYIVDKAYITDDIADEMFVCDLDKCLGACCVEGELGAPLEVEELAVIQQLLEDIRPYLTPEALAQIAREGWYHQEPNGDYSTASLPTGACVFAFRDGAGVLKCGIEQAHREGKIAYPKPISCHLYPLRITRYDEFEAVNYHQWHICAAACLKGKAAGVPLYQFLKTPLIRKYGEEWYNTLVAQISERMPDPQDH
ncbi:DUF3109 family protein [Eisenibacter elegans]|jgi:hypothetical protein|uniref:DUF3109 family protein n=1 Tax=Eisenibacter elegans TaxID=997 RepID=UPI00040D4E60|nr:DUF3109 family protein [Eisenibacter elegans]